MAQASAMPRGDLDRSGFAGPHVPSRRQFRPDPVPEVARGVGGLTLGLWRL